MDHDSIDLTLESKNVEIEIGEQQDRNSSINNSNPSAATPLTQTVDLTNCTGANSSTAHGSGQSKQLKRLLRFNNFNIRFLLLHSVLMRKVHKAEWGKKDDEFTKVLHTFWQFLPSEVKYLHVFRTVNAIKTKVRNMMADRKIHVAFMINQSGFDEEASQVDELLDDFLQELEDIQTKKRKKDDDAADREEALTTAG